MEGVESVAAEEWAPKRSLYTRAMNQAAMFADPGLREPLLEALADTRYNCQAWAAMGCAAMGVREAVPQLIELLDHAQWISLWTRRSRRSVCSATSPPSRRCARCSTTAPSGCASVPADALANIGGAEALEALWDEFEHRRFPRIATSLAAWPLFAPDIIPRLVEAATDRDPNRRYWAAVALGSTGAERVVPTLERLQAEDCGVTVFDGEVRVAAKKALRTVRRIQAAIAARASRA